MPRPKVILFDLGKVLVDFDWRVAANRIAAYSEISAEEIIAFFKGTDLMVRFETGAISPEAFYQEIRAAIGYRSDIDEFRTAFSDIFTEIPEMVRLHAALRAARIPVWIFSNTNDWAVSHIRKEFPFFSEFDGYFLSYVIGAMKPHPRIYESAEHVTGFQGEEILYIDDLAENVEAGAMRGWQAIHHVSHAQTIPQVEQIILGR